LPELRHYLQRYYHKKTKNLTPHSLRTWKASAKLLSRSSMVGSRISTSLRVMQSHLYVHWCQGVVLYRLKRLLVSKTKGMIKATTVANLNSTNLL
jgi:hypothetical protein